MKESNWIPIKDFHGYYEIHSEGKIRSINRMVKTAKGSRFIKSRLIKTRVNNCGYMEVRLNKEARTFTKYVHILLAQAFIPNPECKSEVNHKNGNKLDNTLVNLEWCTRAENMKHAHKSGLIVNTARPVENTCTGEQFRSMNMAAIHYGYCYCTLRKYLNSNNSVNLSCLRYIKRAA